MGYAQEFHVERYFRECLVPRIAPISRVSGLAFGMPWDNADFQILTIGNDNELYQRKGP